MIVEEAIADGQDRTIASEGQLDPVDLLARMVRRDQVLETILDPGHRPPGPDRQEWHQEIFGVELASHAEAAANLRLDEVDTVLGDSE